MAPVREVLLDARTRFHDLLSTDLEQLVAKAVAEDDLQHVSGCLTRETVASLLLCVHSPQHIGIASCESSGQQGSALTPVLLRPALNASNGGGLVTATMRTCRQN